MSQAKQNVKMFLKFNFGIEWTRLFGFVEGERLGDLGLSLLLMLMLLHLLGTDLLDSPFLKSIIFFKLMENKGCFSLNILTPAINQK